MERLQLTANPNRFGSHFNRRFTGPELSALFEDMRQDWWHALHDSKFLVGSILRNEVPKRTLGREIPDPLDCLATTFLHRDAQLRVLSTSKRKRKGKTHLIHPKDYGRAQLAGIDYFLGLTKLDEEIGADLREIRAKVRDRVNLNIPFEKTMLRGVLAEPVHIMAYQAAVLGVPDLCKEDVDWQEGEAEEVKVVFMSPNLPHLRGLPSKTALEDEGSVEREDLRLSDY